MQETLFIFQQDCLAAALGNAKVLNLVDYHNDGLK